MLQIDVMTPWMPDRACCVRVACDSMGQPEDRHSRSLSQMLASRKLPVAVIDPAVIDAILQLAHFCASTRDSSTHARALFTKPRWDRFNQAWLGPRPLRFGFNPPRTGLWAAVSASLRRHFCIRILQPASHLQCLLRSWPFRPILQGSGSRLKRQPHLTPRSY
jgi:hypothetical protein